jgi:hypothetical protein
VISFARTDRRDRLRVVTGSMACLRSLGTERPSDPCRRAQPTISRSAYMHGCASSRSATFPCWAACGVTYRRREGLGALSPPPSSAPRLWDTVDHGGAPAPARSPAAYRGDRPRCGLEEGPTGPGWQATSPARPIPTRPASWFAVRDSKTSWVRRRCLARGWRANACCSHRSRRPALGRARQRAGVRCLISAARRGG